MMMYEVSDILNDVIELVKVYLKHLFQKNTFSDHL